jgi:hypothetical protein
MPSTAAAFLERHRFHSSQAWATSPIKRAKMKTFIGVWIDRRRAVIVKIGQPEYIGDPEPQLAIEELASGVAKRVRTTGGSRTGKTPWGPQQVISESKAEARQRQQMDRFFDRLIAAVCHAERLLLMGPGETKQALAKTIKSMPSLAAKLAGVETCDKMTPNQIAARVRAFFHL